ncbi:hypothetical protein CFC21_037212 [Triticum aestivum]|uniref:Uncharacterized protein n=3 Tax=Triticum TaxID=4564 RepID=A0A9R0VPL5_TRITD|nr:hypothetical protein CFC21_037212 [Triticum aestivum]VAH66737.1 unnamed protein product [Triticum turgidum subsp. durum]
MILVSGTPKRATAPKADRSVLVVLDVEALRGALAKGGVALVGAKGGLGVGLAPHQERRPGLLLVLRLAGPGLEGALLEGTPEGEGQVPGLLGLELVHGVQVQGRLLLTLSTGEEDNGGDGSRDGPLEGADGVLSNHLRGHLLGVGSRGDHVGLQEGALKEDMLVVEGLVAGSKDDLSHVSTAVNVMRSINKDLRLNNGHQPILLADDGIASQTLSVLVDGEL